MSTPPYRVLLADDQVLFRSAVARLIDAEEDFVVVGEAPNGLEALELARRLTPDLVVLDVEMPVMNGVEAAQHILTELPATKVIMLTVADDDEHVIKAIRHGVHGYLLKDLHPNDLFDMLRSAMHDQAPISPALVTRLLAEVRDTRRPRHSAPETPSLSARELEILQLVAQGLSNREIGHRLSITEGTVKNHVHNALHKLHMDNRIQAAAYVVRHGLSAPRPEQ